MNSEQRIQAIKNNPQGRYWLLTQIKNLDVWDAKDAAEQAELLADIFRQKRLEKVEELKITQRFFSRIK